MSGDLQDVLNRGGGIAYICTLTQCTSCSEWLWIYDGYSCGFDAVLESSFKGFCYKCFNELKLNFNQANFKWKEFKYMTSSEYHELQSNAVIAEYNIRLKSVQELQKLK
jgi:hypothetical protein